MIISENQISAIVNQIVQQIQQGNTQIPQPDYQNSSYNGDGVFTTIDEAIRAAQIAQKELIECSLTKRIEIIETIRQQLRNNVQDLARMAHEETGLGRVEDKVVKNLLVINKTPGPEILNPFAHTDEHGMILVERAPWGVIASITPSTNPSETIINNGIGFIAAGNTGVFNAHPGAKKISAHTIRLINKASVAAGGPNNILATISEPTMKSSSELMNHSDINLLVVTGGPGVVKAAFAAGKKVIAGGPGNPPVVVDDTADIAKAGRLIVKGHSFDNNIICLDEKSVFAVASIKNELKEAMKVAGAYEISKNQIDKLTSMVLSDRGGSRPGQPGHANKDFVGKDASYILSKIGINVKDDVRTILCDVELDHPLIWTEQLMPVLPIVSLPDVNTAIKQAVAAEHGYRHTASMYSNNIEKITLMGRTFEGSIFVSNAPNFSGLGEGGAGYTSFTIASPTGDGLTSAYTFSRERRMAMVNSLRMV